MTEDHNDFHLPRLLARAGAKHRMGRSRRLCMHSRRFFCWGALTPPPSPPPAPFLLCIMGNLTPCLRCPFGHIHSMLPPGRLAKRDLAAYCCAKIACKPRRDLFGWVTRLPHPGESSPGTPLWRDKSSQPLIRPATALYAHFTPHVRFLRNYP